MAATDNSHDTKPTVTEKTLEWSDVEQLPVYDEGGATIKFGELYKNSKTIIVFVRDASVRLVVVGCGKHTFIKNFRKITGYNYDLYSDPQATVYSKLGMIRTLSLGPSEKSVHIKSSVAGGFADSIWRTMKSMKLQGDVKQQGGQLVVGPGNVVTYVHLDAGTMDHTPINTLLEIAGVATVDFSNGTK